MPATDTAAKPHRELYCSFCRKSQVDVVVLVAGPGVAICDECVGLCVPIVAGNKGKARTPRTMFQDNWPTEQLLQSLKLNDGAVAFVDRAMQDIVDILREREISWAAIGETLGVSRQAAWKRFG